MIHALERLSIYFTRVFQVQMPLDIIELRLRFWLSSLCIYYLPVYFPVSFHCLPHCLFLLTFFHHFVLLQLYFVTIPVDILFVLLGVVTSFFF